MNIYVRIIRALPSLRRLVGEKWRNSCTKLMEPITCKLVGEFVLSISEKTDRGSFGACDEAVT